MCVTGYDQNLQVNRRERIMVDDDRVLEIRMSREYRAALNSICVSLVMTKLQAVESALALLAQRIGHAPLPPRLGSPVTTFLNNQS